MTTTIQRTASAWSGALIAATIMLAAQTAAAGEPTAGPEPAAGQLLVASASIQDPRFQHSVILIVRHNADGAFGIAINKLLGEQRLAALLADSAGQDQDGGGANGGPIEGTIPVYLGGPVQPQLGFVIHSGEYRRAETVAIATGLAMTATKEALHDIARHRGPAKFLFALGYAGWGPGQLEGELAHGDWFTEPADADLVFDGDRNTVWEKAVARRTREL